MGSATNQEYDSAPGDIRAYDVRSGKVVWTFHTIPHEGEFGYETWPKDAWKTVGGANNWAEMSIDEKRGIVYIPTASPKYNFYGANRKGANLFGDCLLALDARTGKRLWHFQMVHHDIWDYDNATAPKLLTVRHDGKMVDVVAQAGKTGFLYVFDRVTGKPLWPIEERAVPRSDMPGEETWPTQPFPTAPPPFARQSFTEKDLNPFIDDPAERARLLDDIRGARNEGPVHASGICGPRSRCPATTAARTSGGAAVDPDRGRDDRRLEGLPVDAEARAGRRELVVVERRPAARRSADARGRGGPGSRNPPVQERLRLHRHAAAASRRSRRRGRR